MPRTFHLEVITAARVAYENEVISLSVPTRDGRIGIMAGHQPMIAALKQGAVAIRPHDEEQSLELAITGGYLEIEPDKVVIMIDIENEDADDEGDADADFAARYRVEAKPSEPEGRWLPRAVVRMLRVVHLIPKQA